MLIRWEEIKVRDKRDVDRSHKKHPLNTSKLLEIERKWCFEQKVPSFGERVQFE